MQNSLVQLFAFVHETMPYPFFWQLSLIVGPVYIIVKVSEGIGHIVSWVLQKFCEARDGSTL